MSGLRKLLLSVGAGAVIAVLIALGLQQKRDAPKTEAASSNRWSGLSLFQGIGSTGTGSGQEKKDFSASTAKAFTGVGGHQFDLEGLTALQFIQKYSAAARAGDPSAAYRVYEAEALCAGIPDAKASVEVMKQTQRAEVYRQNLVDVTEACVGVTPALMEERREFLFKAANGGVDSARIDFLAEGPQGNLQKDDPAFAQWSSQAIDFLRQSVAGGNSTALVLLAQVFSNGQITPADLPTAIMYEVAATQLQAHDPATNPWITKMSRQLTPEQVKAAFEQGNQLAAQIGGRKS